MSDYQAITHEHHAGLHWQRATLFAFAAADSVVPLSASELPRAAMSLPIAFIAQGDGFVPAAVLGLQPGFNLFVTADWRWVGQYIPAAFRTYPFRLGQTETGKQVLCIDQDSGLLPAGPAGEPFFVDDQPAPAVQDVLNFLTQTEQHRLATAAICAALQKHQLICPWPITLQTETGEKQITGLFQVDEAAFNRLSSEDLLEIREAGALPVVYCQLLSMQHLATLGQLADAHAKARAQASAALQAAPSSESSLDFFNKGGTFNFSNL